MNWGGRVIICGDFPAECDEVFSDLVKALSVDDSVAVEETLDALDEIFSGEIPDVRFRSDGETVSLADIFEREENGADNDDDDDGPDSRDCGPDSD